MDFSGVFAALTTPFAADDSVAIADLKQNIQRYNATGLAGYAVQGSTGESVLLSRAEWDSVLVAAKEAASPQALPSHPPRTAWSAPRTLRSSP